jgi:hypothetical protein
VSELSEYIEAHIPDGWKLSNLFDLSPGYQANICDGERVAIGTGDTMEEALLSAGTKAENHITVGRLAMISESMKLFRKEQDKIEGNNSNLLNSLGLSKPKPKIARRL